MNQLRCSGALGALRIADVANSNAQGNRLDFCSRSCEVEYNKKK